MKKFLSYLIEQKHHIKNEFTQHTVRVLGLALILTSFIVLTVKAATATYNQSSLTLYAQWEPHKYTLELYYNQPTAAQANKNYIIKGESTVLNPDEITYESKAVTFDSAVGTLPSVSLEGWSFDGWKLDTDNDGSYDTLIKATDSWVWPAANNGATFKAQAQWSAGWYTVTYDAGTGISGSFTADQNKGSNPDHYDGSINNSQIRLIYAYDGAWNQVNTTNLGTASTSNGVTTYTINGVTYTKTEGYPVIYTNYNNGREAKNNADGTHVTHYDKKYAITYKDSDSYPDLIAYAETWSDQYSVDYWAYKGWKMTTDKDTYYNEGTTSVQFNPWGYNGTDNFMWNAEGNAKNLTCNSGANIKFTAQWSDLGITPPAESSEKHVFKGWWTTNAKIGSTSPSENDEYAGLPDPGTYYGGTANENTNGTLGIDITSDTTLYAWWNTVPVFFDVLEGTFYEGQVLSYNDLLKIVGAYDFENDYMNEARTLLDKLYWIEEVVHPGTGSDKDDDDLEQEGDGGNSSSHAGETESDYQQEDPWVENVVHELSEETKAAILAEIHDLIGSDTKNTGKTNTGTADQVTNLDIKIIGIQYYNNNNPMSIDASGTQKSAYDTTYLNTSTRNVGTLYLTYQASDMGLLSNIVGNYIPSNNNVNEILSAPIVVTYKRECEIVNNYFPWISKHDLMFTYDELNSMSEDTLNSEILLGQVVEDTEDYISNIPWWTVGDKYKTDDSVSINNEETYKYLQDSLYVEKIGNILLDSQSQVKYPGLQTALNNQNITTLEGLLAIKNGTYTCDGTSVSGEYILQHIIGFNVVFDSVDQFGKHASGKVDTIKDSSGTEITADDGNTIVVTPKTPTTDHDTTPENEYDIGKLAGFGTEDDGMTELERTITVIVVNANTDNLMIKSNTVSNKRFIDEKYIDTLLDTEFGTSFWASDKGGSRTLQSAFEIAKEQDAQYKTYKYTTVNKNGNQIDVEIHDYTVE